MLPEFRERETRCDLARQGVHEDIGGRRGGADVRRGRIRRDRVLGPPDLSARALIALPNSPTGEPMWSPDTAWPDFWVLIGAMAAVTRRLRFSNATGSVQARRRHRHHGIDVCPWAGLDLPSGDAERFREPIRTVRRNHHREDRLDGFPDRHHVIEELLVAGWHGVVRAMPFRRNPRWRVPGAWRRAARSTCMGC